MTQVTMRKRQAGPAGRSKTFKAQDRAVELGVSRKTYYRYLEQGMPKGGTLQQQRAWIAIAKNRQTPEPATPAPKTEAAAAAAGTTAEPPRGGPMVRTWADAERQARIALAEQKTAKGRQRIIDEEREAITAEAYELLAGLKAEIEGLCPDCRGKIEAMLETTVRKMKERGECANG